MANNIDTSECLTIKNAKHVLSIMAELAVAFPQQNKHEDGQPHSQGAVLTVHEKGMSRYVLKIIDNASKGKDASKKAVFANIPATNVYLLSDVVSQIPRTLLCIGDMTTEEQDIDGTANEEGEAKFLTGKYKGKTPKQIISAEGASAIEPLKKSVDWLTANLAKYPANQQLIDAINSSIESFEKGTLNAAESASNPDVVTVYNALRSLNLKADDNSKVFTYTLKIQHDASPVKGKPRQYPWSIEIANYYCPFTAEGNFRKPIMSSAELINKMKMNISEDDFRRAIHVMRVQVDAFTGTVFMNRMRTLYPNGQFGRRSSK